jgi:glutathione S-transferase
MTLYTCPWQRRSSGWHPCGVAAKALDAAGHRYEIRVVRGQLSMPWTWISRRRDRAEVRALSGQNGVPVLVLDDGEAIAGSARIAAWAAEHPASAPPGREIGTLEAEGGS